MQPYRSTRFASSFRGDTAGSSCTRSELVSFRVSTHACPGTSSQVYLNGYMGVQVSRRTRMQMGPQLIQGRNNDNPSFLADDRAYLSVPTKSTVSQDFGKIR